MKKHRRTADDFARDMQAKQSNPTRAETADRETYIKRGQDAWQRHKSDATWTDWLAIGEALDIGRSDAMSAAGTNKPEGSRYNQAFSKWLARHGFDDIDKGDRKRLFDVLEHRSEIEQWRITLPRSERLRSNHPSTVWRKWQASTKPKQPKSPKPTDGNPSRELEAAKAHIAELEAARGGEPLTPDQLVDQLIAHFDNEPKAVMAAMQRLRAHLEKFAAGKSRRRTKVQPKDSGISIEFSMPKGMKP